MDLLSSCLSPDEKNNSKRNHNYDETFYAFQCVEFYRFAIVKKYNVPVYHLTSVYIYKNLQKYSSTCRYIL